jgi:hypothetical protein
MYRYLPYPACIFGIAVVIVASEGWGYLHGLTTGSFMQSCSFLFATESG